MKHRTTWTRGALGVLLGAAGLFAAGSAWAAAGAAGTNNGGANNGAANSGAGSGAAVSAGAGANGAGAGASVGSNAGNQAYGSGMANGSAANGASPGGAAGPNQVAIQGVARGVVSNVNLSKGSLSLQTTNGTITLRAQPTQIAGLRPGEQFVAHYENFGGQTAWLTDNLNATGSGRAFGRAGQVTGDIISLNKIEGTLTLNEVSGNGHHDRTFHAHPMEIQNLLPGQFVTVNFQSIGGVNWIQGVGRAGRTGSAR
jgi:hypothetical protein